MLGMCGFAGEFLFADGRADLHLAKRMASLLAHRGPDEEATYLSPDGRCAIGVRRLAVIDPLGSHQPMASPDGGRVVAFNGEIYNYRQLRAELGIQGCQFRTDGDTEVLLHLYDRDGDDMLRHLDGMFAFALYDAALGQLLLCRDRLGEKPLWYAALPDRLIFASEAKALLTHPRVSPEPDARSLTVYCTMGYIPAPRSAYRSVAKLAPASMLALSRDCPAPRRYWRPALALPAPSAHELREQVRSQVVESVRARLVSDVPLGALLSGGLDSAIVVAAMSRIVGKAGGVRTFTAGFEDPAFDERADAAVVANHCGTDHTELLVRPAPAEALDKIVTMYDEPFGDSSALPTWMICQLARQHVTVALTGDGGDEVFGGYDRYRALRLAATIGPFTCAAIRFAAAIMRPFAPHRERSGARRLVRFADAMMYPLAIQYFTYRRLFGPDDLARLLNPDFAAGVDIDAPAQWFCRLYERADAPSEVTAAQLHDIETYLPDDLLVKTDIASMACSLELRPPMLDHRLVTAGVSLPVEQKVGRRQGKLLLRQAFADWLPPEVFARPKRGFGVPLADWLRGPLREPLREALLSPCEKVRAMFSTQALAGLVNDHLNGRADHSHRLWALLVLARWMERLG